MRLMKAHPEAERLILRPGFEELAKIARIILRADARGGHLLGQLVKTWSGRIARPHGLRPKVARSPTFAGETDEVARLFQEIGIDLEAGGKQAVVRDGFSQLPSIAP